MQEHLLFHQAREARFGDLGLFGSTLHLLEPDGLMLNRSYVRITPIF